MTQPPLISVLLSVYNAERYLAQAVESILNQTLTDFEFLITDDGSCDRSLPILQDYAAQDARIRLWQAQNQGLPRSLNRMLAVARGEFIARMDADDISLPERFARQVEFLRAHPQVVCLGTAQDWIDEDGERLFSYIPDTANADLQTAMLAGHNHLCHPATMMRRAALCAVGGYDENLRSAQDLDLWLRLGEIGELANLPEVLFQYRLHFNSISEKHLKQQSANAQAICQRAWQRRGIQGEYTAHTVSWRHRLLLQVGWQTFNRGKRRKAMAHGARAIRVIPFNREGWRLLICALIKPIPGEPT
ncbi:MAG: glycosyltransferase [Synechococcales cyanobacterium C42_A2020_086]|jgi:hypothetical protein|nr:glycosyltransferase [Synechococcales cyanobacterium C42_A2020_086]